MELDLHTRADLGYRLYAPRRHNEPGYSQIDVNLASEPSEHHFDPERIEVVVESDYGGLDCMEVTHPWSGGRLYRVCAGQFDLIDRKGKHLEAFTFGGELVIVADNLCTTLTLKSPAPILLMFSMHSAPTLLAQEVEILLAQRRAAWEHDPETFDRRLVAADPLALYLACLEAIRQRFAHFPNTEDDFMVKFKHTIKAEIDHLKDEWSPVLPMPTLEAIL
jgi:hypothetical protein